MSCTSGIYVVNTTAVDVTAGNAVPIQTTVRRYGCALYQQGFGVNARSQGYYDVKANITLTPTNAGLISATICNDGVPVTGATATITGTAANEQAISLSAIIRRGCCGDPNNITVVLSADASVINASMIVEKL